MAFGGEVNFLLTSFNYLNTFLVPLFFTIISLTIRSPRIEQQEYFYSVDILINSTCPSKRESNITLIFQSSSLNETKRCLLSSKHHGLMTCENFIYGKINYQIILC